MVLVIIPVARAGRGLFTTAPLCSRSTMGVGGPAAVSFVTNAFVDPFPREAQRLTPGHLGQSVGKQADRALRRRVRVRHPGPWPCP